MFPKYPARAFFPVKVPRPLQGLTNLVHRRQTKGQDGFWLRRRANVRLEADVHHHESPGGLRRSSRVPPRMARPQPAWMIWVDKGRTDGVRQPPRRCLVPRLLRALDRLEVMPLVALEPRRKRSKGASRSVRTGVLRTERSGEQAPPTRLVRRARRRRWPAARRQRGLRHS